MTKIDDGEAFETIVGEAGNPLVLLCDHAANHVPAEYGALGLPKEQFERHIGYDIGARDTVLGLAAKLGGRAVLSKFSRLLIDPNRGMDDPTLIMRISDGAVVPGNAGVDEAERQHRIDRFHRPYHQAVTATIEGVLAQSLTPLIISIHSFTPAWKGVPRPWHVGILWDQDEVMARAMISGFERQGDLVVGDNEPYSGALQGDTLYTHATLRQLPHALVEIRQDLIASKTGVDEWVDRLAQVIEPIMYGTARRENA